PCRRRRGAGAPWAVPAADRHARDCGERSSRTAASGHAAGFRVDDLRHAAVLLPVSVFRWLSLVVLLGTIGISGYYRRRARAGGGTLARARAAPRVTRARARRA